MHRAVEHNTMYYRLSSAQTVWLRRGSKWQPMLLKIGLCLGSLVTLKQFRAQSDDGCEDKAWIETFFLLMAGYQLATSSLYIMT